MSQRVNVAAAGGLLAVGFGLGLTSLLVEGPARPTDLIWLVAVMAFLVVGALVVARQPGNRMGWLFAVAGLVWLLVLAAAALTDAWLVNPSDLATLGPVAGWLSGWLFIPAGALVGFAVPLLFPDGRLPSPRWRPVAVGAAIYVGVASLAGALWPGTHELGAGSYANPLGVAWLSWIPEPDGFTMGVPPLILLAAVSVAQRYRRSSDMERHQLKWFLAAVGMLVACFPVFAVAEGVFGIFLDPLLLPFAVMMIPFAAGIAIFRYRLYEIDRIISRTVSYALLTGLLAAIYLLAVMALQQLLRPVTGESQLAVAGATLLVAAVFGPARRRVQNTVDRRFNRARYDAQRTVEAFRVRLRDKLDIDELTAELTSTAAATVAPTTVQVWLRRRATER